jgi:hypothetical protein
MGGYGSGKKSGGNNRQKLLCEQFYQLNIGYLAKEGILRNFGTYKFKFINKKYKEEILFKVQSSNNILKFEYVLTDVKTGEPITYKYKIALDYTKNKYGKRPWFKCPICHRRSGVLYQHGYFACRKCLDLNYESTTITHDKAYAVRKKIERLRKLLSVPDRTNFMDIAKPLRMRQSTYEKLHEQLFYLYERKFEILKQTMLDDGGAYRELCDMWDR